jgi:hypothetical protein
MREHPESELHKCGKMFGVLLYEGGYLAAFSAKLDGSYHHEGFVPPVYELTTPPVGTSKAESQRLQRLLFANYHFINGKGESKNLLEIFKDEKPIVPAEEWFNKSQISNHQLPITNYQSPITNAPIRGRRMLRAKVTTICAHAWDEAACFSRVLGRRAVKDGDSPRRDLLCALFRQVWTDTQAYDARAGGVAD